MDVTVRGKHFDVPEHVAERAKLKFSRLEHYLPLLRDAIVEVDVSQERTKEPEGRFLVTVTVRGSRAHLRAEERAARPEEAVDMAAHVLAGQARRQKQRLYRRGRTGASKDAASPEDQSAAITEFDDDEPGPLDLVSKVKRFSVKPMTTEEAVEQMELLTHDFFIFHDADIDQFALLYRRRAGDYGLIIPELS
jgi:putative sigma-54 modulation protein